MKLTIENYKKGLLVDDEFMAGVTEDPDQPGKAVAFVLNHLSGEYLAYEPFDDVEAALASINSLERDWEYEKGGGGCGDGACGEGGCRGGGCGAGGCEDEAGCEDGACCDEGHCGEEEESASACSDGCC